MRFAYIPILTPFPMFPSAWTLSTPYDTILSHLPNSYQKQRTHSHDMSWKRIRRKLGITGAREHMPFDQPYNERVSERQWNTTTKTYSGALNDLTGRMAFTPGVFATAIASWRRWAQINLEYTNFHSLKFIPRQSKVNINKWMLAYESSSSTESGPTLRKSAAPRKMPSVSNSLSTSYRMSRACKSE